MPVHIAILMRPYLKLILEGRKTVESRLTKGPLPRRPLLVSTGAAA